MVDSKLKSCPAQQKPPIYQLALQPGETFQLRVKAVLNHNHIKSNLSKSSIGTFDIFFSETDNSLLSSIAPP